MATPGMVQIASPCDSTPRARSHPTITGEGETSRAHPLKARQPYPPRRWSGVKCQVSGVGCRVCVVAVSHIEDVDTAGREGDL